MPVATTEIAPALLMPPEKIETLLMLMPTLPVMLPELPLVMPPEKVVTPEMPMPL